MNNIKGLSIILLTAALLFAGLYFLSGTLFGELPESEYGIVRAVRFDKGFKVYHASIQQQEEYSPDLTQESLVARGSYSSGPNALEPNAGASYSLPLATSVALNRAMGQNYSNASYSQSSGAYGGATSGLNSSFASGISPSMPAVGVTRAVNHGFMAMASTVQAGAATSLFNGSNYAAENSSGRQFIPNPDDGSGDLNALSVGDGICTMLLLVLLYLLWKWWKNRPEAKLPITPTKEKPKILFVPKYTTFKLEEQSRKVVGK
jgi:hypothetical protein